MSNAVNKCIQCGVPFCEVCGTCETDGCVLIGKQAMTKTDLIVLKHLLATTQKARGYVALQEAGLNVPSPFFVVTEDEDITAAVEKYLAGLLSANAKNPMFVRPCPVRPRHGFVESRSVPMPDLDKSHAVQKAVREIFVEARKADPQAELLIVPAVDATHNIILTPSRMAIGTGNDGATAGKKSITVPLAGVMFSELTPELLKQGNVDPEVEDPYIEVVVKKFGHQVYKQNGPNDPVLFTQLRAGAKIPASMGDDYIPAEMEVKRTVLASGDLMEWEKQVLELQPGDVVYSVGGSLLSHYGVHCVFAKIPILTTRVPVVGEVLKVTKVMVAPDPRSIIEGLGAGMLVPIKCYNETQEKDALSTSQASILVCTILHNATAMGGTNGFWLGVAVALMIRLGMTASHGEARHSNEARSLSREYVYKLALNEFFAARNTLGNAQERFLNYSWSSGYGGSKWAECTASVFEMDNAVRALLMSPTDENVPPMVQALNKAVNQAHNGGWWLNKFVPQHAFEEAANQSMHALASAGAGFLLVGTFKSEKIVEAIQQWTVAEAIVVPEVVAVALSTVQGETQAPVTSAEENGEALNEAFKCGDSTCDECYPPVEVQDEQTEEIEIAV